MAVNFSEFKRMSHVCFLAKIVIYLLLILSEVIVSWEKSDMPVRKNRLFFLKKQISLCQAKIDERRNVCHDK